MRQHVLTDANCPAPEVHLLGEIVVVFGNLEFALEVAIWQLLGSRGRIDHPLMAQAITAEMSFRQKVDALISMLRQEGIVPPDVLPELDALRKELFFVEQERNQLLHSAWNYSDALDGSFSRMKASAKAKGGLRRTLHQMPAERIEKIRQNSVRAWNSLARFTRNHIQTPDEADNEDAG